MPLQQYPRTMGIITPVCATDLIEQTNRNFDAIRRILAIIIQNDREVITNNGLLFGEEGRSTIPMQAKWAISLGQESGETFIAPTAGNGWRGQIQALPCDDSQGNNVDVAPIWVVLPERRDMEVYLPEGSIFAYEQTNSGELVAVTDYTLIERIVRFELTEPQVPGDSADAVVVRWVEDAEVATEEEIEVHDANDPGRWRGATGYRGIAIKKADSDRYEIIFLEEVAEFAVVTLTEAMSAGVSDAATVESYWNGNDPGETISVYDVETGLFDDLEAGDVLVVAYNWTLGRYHPITVRDGAAAATGARFIEFTANHLDGMTGGSMAVDVDAYWGDPDPGATATVTDPCDLFLRALGPMESIRTGARGLAVFDTNREQWIVIECQSQAGWILCQLQANPADGEVQVSVISYHGTQQDIQNPGTTLTIKVIAGISDNLVEDDFTIAIYSADEDEYYAINPQWRGRWAIAQTDPSPGDVLITVACRFCDDATGANPHGPNFDVILPFHDGISTYVQADAVISIMRQLDDTWVCTSVYTAARYELDGALVAVRPRLNFVNDGNVTFTLTDVPDSKAVTVEGNVGDPPPTKAGHIRFQLTEDKPGSSANAEVLAFWGTERDILSPLADEQTELIVYDNEVEYPWALEGAIGTAVLDKVADVYRIVTCQQRTMNLLGNLGDDITSATTTVDIDSPTVLDHEPFNQAVPGTVTASNIFGFEGDEGAPAFVRWDKANNRWILIQIMCPE